MSTWSQRTTNTEAYRRAGGRRGYNALRQFRQALRRMEVAHLLTVYGLEYGALARIGRELGVSRATIGRDVSQLRAHPCPCCGRVTIPDVDE